MQWCVCVFWASSLRRCNSGGGSAAKCNCFSFHPNIAEYLGRGRARQLFAQESARRICRFRIPPSSSRLRKRGIVSDRYSSVVGRIRKSLIKDPVPAEVIQAPSALPAFAKLASLNTVRAILCAVRITPHGRLGGRRHHRMRLRPRECRGDVRERVRGSRL